MRTAIRFWIMTLTLGTALVAVPGQAYEGERDGLRKGVFEGIWHTDPVTIIILSVERDGSFKGEMHFDPNGRWGDVRCGIFGRVEENGSLTVTRDDCPQTARTGRPERRGRLIVWRGEVRGADFTSSFELRIPEGRR
jgi:hypothetical protein